MNFEKRLEKHLENNAELRKVFEEHPERKELYIQKLKDQWNENWGCDQIKPVFCKTCIFAHGEAPFADQPEKAYCAIFEHGKGSGKPPAVYYDGEPCEFYEKDDRKKD